jgi:phosphatidylglycerophosphate synthase
MPMGEAVMRDPRSLLSKLMTPPNALTLLRFLCVPVLWVFAVLKLREGVGWGLALALATDLIDGPIARRMNQTSRFGSKFDSLADQILQLSAIAWVLLLMPEIFIDNPLASALAIATYLASLIVGILKFKRIANLHLHLSKASGLVLYAFLIHAFLAGRYSPILFAFASAGFVMSSAETLLLQLLHSKVDEHIGSLLFLYLPSDHPLRRLARKLP